MFSNINKGTDVWNAKTFCGNVVFVYLSEPTFRVHTYSNQLLWKRASFSKGSQLCFHKKGAQTSHSHCHITYRLLVKKKKTMKSKICPLYLPMNRSVEFTASQTDKNLRMLQQRNISFLKRVKTPSGYLGHKGWQSTKLIWLGKPNRSKLIKYRVNWKPLAGSWGTRGKQGLALLFKPQ